MQSLVSSSHPPPVEASSYTHGQYLTCVPGIDTAAEASGQVKRDGQSNMQIGGQLALMLSPAVTRSVTAAAGLVLSETTGFDAISFG